LHFNISDNAQLLSDIGKYASAFQVVHLFIGASTSTTTVSAAAVPVSTSTLASNSTSTLASNLAPIDDIGDIELGDIMVCQLH
jgi:hypothetical protein